MANFNPANYVDVQERINRFWSEYPDGAIVTNLVSPTEDFDHCRYEARIYKHRDDNRHSASGWAFEIAGGGGANRTSHEENCETSAIGRALANMAYAKTRDDRPSRQEMNKVADDAPPRDRSTTRNTVPEPPQRPQTNATPKPAQDHALVDQKGLTALFAVTKDRSVSNEDLHAIARKRYGVESLKDLRVDHARDLYLIFQKESDEGLQHELYLATREPGADDEPADSVLTPRTSNPMFAS